MMIELSPTLRPIPTGMNTMKARESGHELFMRSSGGETSGGVPMIQANANRQPESSQYKVRNPAWYWLGQPGGG